MVRLAQMSARGGQDGPGRSDAFETTEDRGRRLMRIYFGIGLACSGILGSLAFLTMLLLATGPAHDRWFASTPQKSMLALYDALPRLPARAEAPSLTVLDIAVPRAEKGGARMVLDRALAQAAETRSADDFAVLLRGVPAQVTLSRGARSDAAWRLAKADLRHLYIVLGPAAPEAFELGLDVELARGQARPLARLTVHVVDEAATARNASVAEAPALPTAVRPAAAAPAARRGEAATAGEPPAAKRPAAPARQVPVLAGTVTRLPAARATEEASARSVNLASPPGVQEGRPEIARPKGLNSLGGPGAATVGSDPDTLFGRKVWWRMPELPAWSPFKQ